jgi:hypothetical protein
MIPVEFLKQRWLVLGNWPGRQPDRYHIGEIITEANGPNELPRNQYGELRFPLPWEDCPLLFQKLMWWEEREEELMKTVKYLKNTKRNQFYQVSEMVPAFSIEEDIYSFKAKNRRGQEIVGYIDLTKDYIPITEEEFNRGK